MTLDHDELSADCGLYVLGTLGTDERRHFEEHLRTCEECTASVRQLRTVAGSLPYAVPLIEPSADLRHRVIEAASRARSPRVRSAPIAFERRVEPKPNRSLPALVGFMAAAASLVVAVGFGIRASNLQNRLRDTEARMLEAIGRLDDAERRLQASQRETTTIRRTLALLTSADTVELRLVGQPPAPQASARAFLSRSRGVLFVGANLPQVPTGRTYQIWYLTRGAPLSAGLFKPDEQGNGTATLDVPNVPTFAGMAVSLEPEGGVPAPTGAIYLATQ
jgi:anti-sigma-K factor RskA